MEIDVIDQLKRQMDIFGVGMCHLCPPYEEKMLTVGIERIISKDYNFEEDLSRMKKWCEDATLYMIKDNFEENYITFKIPDQLTEGGREGSGEEFIQIGPYLTESPETIIDKVMKKNQLSLGLRKEIEEYYYGVAYIQSKEILETLIILQAGYLFGGKEKVLVNRIENFYGKRFEVKEIAAELGKQKNMLQIEERYRYEDQMLEAVKNGDLEKVIEAGNNFQSCRMKPRNQNSLRNNKNLMLTLNTLLRKAVQQADVHPAHIDQLSARFAKRIEDVSHTKELETIGQEMRRKYCMLVRNHSLQGYSSMVRDALNYIDFNMKEPLSLKLLAEQMNVNASYLSTQFKKETGKTLTNYINEKRIQSSLIFLTTTDLPIQAVAEQVGIYDENYFSRLFKKYKNQTAKEYRNLMKAKF